MLDVAIYLYGDDLDPEIVTRAIGVPPTKSWKKDDVAYARGEMTVRRRTGVWELMSPSKSADLSDHIAEIALLLKYRNVKNLKEIPSVNDALFDVLLLVDVELPRKKNLFMCLERDEVLYLGELGLRVSIAFGTVSEADF